jgi:hypothetical protein
VDNIDPHPAVWALLGKEVILSIDLGYPRLGELLPEECRYPVADGRRLTGKFYVMNEAERFLEPLVHDEGRLGNDLPDPWKPLDGTGNEIDRQEIEQKNEPPGVIHVKETEAVVNLELGLADRLKVFRGRRTLGDDGTDDRRNGETDEKENGKFQGTEKIPYRLYDSAIVRCQSILLKAWGGFVHEGAL